MVRNHKRFRLLCIKCRKNDQANYKIEIKRDPDGMEMPIDLVVISKFGLKKISHSK